MEAEPTYDNEAMQALIRAYVACKLAIDALPELPLAIRRAVEEPVETLCRVVGPELQRVNPELVERETDRLPIE